MASISAPKAVAIKPTLKTAPAVAVPAKAAPAKTVLKVVAPVAAPVVAAPKKSKEEVTAMLNASREKRFAEAETDELTGLRRLNPKGFRWVCKDAIVACWPASGNVAEFSMDDCVETCKSLYAERGGNDETITPEIWAKQVKIIRKWLASPGINKAMAGDDINVPKEQDPAKLEEMRGRLAKGRATAAANRAAKVGNVDAGDDDAVTDE